MRFTRHFGNAIQSLTLLFIFLEISSAPRRFRLDFAIPRLSNVDALEFHRQDRG